MSIQKSTFVDANKEEEDNDLMMNNGGFFYIISSQISFNNVSFENCVANKGGAIYISGLSKDLDIKFEFTNFK